MAKLEGTVSKNPKPCYALAFNGRQADVFASTAGDTVKVPP